VNLTIIEVNDMYNYSLPVAVNTVQMRRPRYTPVVTTPLLNRRRHFCCKHDKAAKPNGRAVWGVGLQPLTCCDCGFEFRRGHGCLSVVSVGNCQVEVSVSVWSLVQRSPIEYGVSECDREASIMKRTWPNGSCCAIKMRIKYRKDYKLPIFPITKRNLFFSNIK
jgi:hypothetical protein